MKQYVVDAFTDKVFEGNPTAVCIMEEWPTEELMIKITKENNLSETAFAVKEGKHYKLRWFTPGGEIDLCGHATLATAFVINTFIEPGLKTISFETLSGTLTVQVVGELYEMDFPGYDIQQVQVTREMAEAVGVNPVEAYIGRDLLLVVDDEQKVRNLNPDMNKVARLDGLLVHVTARGSDYDCVSRSFAPKLNVTEDPVCGSGHCHIIPYWSNKLELESLTAFQASPRSGVLYCKNQGDRVKLSGKAVLYSIAELFV